MTKAEMRDRVEEAMKSYNGSVTKSTKVLGKELLSKYTANYRAGSGRTRMGKNGSGKYRMTETRGLWSAFV